MLLMSLTLYRELSRLWFIRPLHTAGDGAGLLPSDVMDGELHTAGAAIGAESGRELLRGWHDVVTGGKDSEDQKHSDIPGHDLPFFLHSGVELHIRAFQHG